MVGDKQLQLAWQIVNEMSRWKSTTRAKLKTVSQEERLQKWREHFKNLLLKSLKTLLKKLLKINPQYWILTIGLIIEDACGKNLEAMLLYNSPKHLILYTDER